jgi:hypothetical protein
LNADPNHWFSLLFISLLLFADEIQKWLSLSAEELAHWRALGSGFMAWSLRYIKGKVLKI